MARKEDLRGVCSLYGLKALYAFGSRAREAAVFCRTGQAHVGGGRILYQATVLKP
jgi:hypothetical protein